MSDSFRHDEARPAPHTCQCQGWSPLLKFTHLLTDLEVHGSLALEFLNGQGVFRMSWKGGMREDSSRMRLLNGDRRPMSLPNSQSLYLR